MGAMLQNNTFRKQPPLARRYWLQARAHVGELDSDVADWYAAEHLSQMVLHRNHARAVVHH